MKMIKLKKEEQFLELKKGDLIAVKWSRFFVKHHENAETEMTYNIHENKSHSDEIICKIKGNHYFNYKMHLGLDTPGVNTSNALEVYLIK